MTERTNSLKAEFKGNTTGWSFFFDEDGSDAAMISLPTGTLTLTKRNDTWRKERPYAASYRLSVNGLSLMVDGYGASLKKARIEMERKMAEAMSHMARAFTHSEDALLSLR